jgi:hypothetical protein
VLGTQSDSVWLEGKLVAVSWGTALAEMWWAAGSGPDSGSEWVGE